MNSTDNKDNGVKCKNPQLASLRDFNIDEDIELDCAFWEDCRNFIYSSCPSHKKELPMSCKICPERGLHNKPPPERSEDTIIRAINYNEPYTLG